MTEYGSGSAGQGDVAAFHSSHRTRRTPTSDLSVAEAAALRRVGLSPIGFVMGTSVMQLVASFTGTVVGGPTVVGGGYWGNLLSPVRSRGGYAESFPCAHGFAWGGASAEHYGFNAEDGFLEGSLFTGYRLALERIEEEATSLGAHGVVGVEFVFEHLVGSSATATFLARGTAVVHRGSPPLERPFLTNASGQNLERLVRLGYTPAGIAVGVGVVFVKPNCMASGNLTAVGPIRQIPAAIAVARSRARQSLASTAHKVGQGVVHTDWTDRRFARYGESWNQLALAVGTSVRRYRSETEPEAPRPVVSLRP